MAEHDPSDRDDHPVLVGLVALVGVALVVGMIIGVAVLAGTRMLGLDGDEAAAENTGEQSLVLPRPEPTRPDPGPQITLLPGPTQQTEEVEPSEPESSKKPQRPISLSASQSQVAPMEQIDLSGVYPGGEGAILRVERFAGGRWEDFAQITANVSNETFTTYVQTGQIGTQRFRMVDTDTGRTSNEVRVRVG